MKISTTARTLVSQHSLANFLTQAAPALTIAVALAIFFKNAWVSDDAYITFRIVEQLFAGNGPNWNPHERAMVYTSPAWYWLLCAGRLITTDLYIVSTAVSLILWATTLAVINQTLKGWLPFALAVLLMVSSNGFYDFTTSGLENPMAYSAVAIYGMFYIRRLDGKNDAVPLLLTMGAAVLVRHDIVTLLLTPTVYAVWQDRHNRTTRSWATWTATALAPIAAWTAFSLLYYGFPFPNTMYAKTNIDLPRHAIILQHGLDYWLTNLQRDITTPLTIFLAMGAAMIAPATVRKPALALAAGIVANCAYVTYIGGDFMIGRFLATAFLASIFALYLCTSNDGTRQANPKLWYGRLSAVLLALMAINLYAHTPMNSPTDHTTEEAPVGAVDERGWYFPAMSLKQYARKSEWENVHPPTSGAQLGTEISQSNLDNIAHLVRDMGMTGYYAGTDRVVFDYYGLASPMIARTNGHPNSRIGHYHRAIPNDIMAAHELGPDIIKDPAIRNYYRKMSLVTQSPNLLAPERLREILLLNTVHRKLHLAYADSRTGKEAQPAHVRE